MKRVNLPKIIANQVGRNNKIDITTVAKIVFKIIFKYKN